MKSLKITTIAIVILVFSLSNPLLSKATNFIEETESNNTMEKAQPINVIHSYIENGGVKYNELSGNLSDINDVDWYVFELESEGHLDIELRDKDGLKSPFLPFIQTYATRYDSSFGAITDNYKVSGNGFMNHKPKNKVYVKIFNDKTNEFFKSGKYQLRITFKANPSKGFVNEPNNIIDLDKKYYEYIPIQKDVLLDMEWENKHYDPYDNFSILGTNKGKLSFEVHYPLDEFQYWKDKKIDHYLIYNLYAEKKDGSLEVVDYFMSTGMPNQVFKGEASIDNTNYTGKYVIELKNNQKVNFSYKLKVSFNPSKEDIGTKPQPEPEQPEQPEQPQPEPNEPIEEKQVIIERLSGSTRYETNKVITSKIPSKSLDYVILANGKDFPDALTGGVLSNKNATVLLVNDNLGIRNEMLNETKRLLKNNGEVIILGGTSAVSQNIENTFKKSFKVNRIGGIDRYETAVKIAELSNSKPNEVFIAYGKGFADALSIVPYATKINAPILLNSSKNGIDKFTKQYLEKHKTSIKKVTIIGGTSIIPSEIQNQLKQLGISKVERVSGATRYETSLEIAKKFYPNTKSAGIANGFSFPDSLSGSSFAYRNDMPIIMVKDNLIPTKILEYIKGKSMEQFYLFGGEAVLTEQVKQSLK